MCRDGVKVHTYIHTSQLPLKWMILLMLLMMGPGTRLGADHEQPRHAIARTPSRAACNCVAGQDGCSEEGGVVGSGEGGERRGRGVGRGKGTVKIAVKQK